MDITTNDRTNDRTDDYADDEVTAHMPRIGRGRHMAGHGCVVADLHQLRIAGRPTHLPTVTPEADAEAHMPKIRGGGWGDHQEQTEA